MRICRFIKKPIFLLFTCLIIPNTFLNANTNAKDWFELKISDKYKVWYINIKSIIQNGRYTQYWCKVHYLNPKALPHKDVSYTKVHFISDCYRNLMSINELTGYNKNKKILFRESSKNLNQLTPIVPDSIYQSIHNSVCKYALYSE